MWLLASQWLSAQQTDTISHELQNKIYNNFLLYKNTVGFPYDTIYSDREHIEENAYDPRKNIVTPARWGKGYGHIVFNTSAPDSIISDQVIVHEMTHARKDTVYAPIDYTLNDGNKIIGVNGLTFKVSLSKEWKTTVFGLPEEAIAEYITRKLTGKTDPDLDPRYYALLCFMKRLDEYQVITPKNMLYAIDHDDYKHFLSVFGRENHPHRWDNIFWFFTQIYNFWLDQNGSLDLHLSSVEEKVRQFTKEYIKPIEKK